MSLLRPFLAFTVLLLSCFVQSFGQKTVVYDQANENLDIGKNTFILEDAASSLTPQKAFVSKGFTQSQLSVPNFEVTNAAFWLKFKIKNNSSSDNLVLNIAYPTIDSVGFFVFNNDSSVASVHSGEYIPYYKRNYKHQNYIFSLMLPVGTERTYLLRVKASEQLQVPLEIGTEKSVFVSIFNRELLFGLYAGIILVMFFYNIFIYFTVNDRTYLYYVLYILFVGLTQAGIQGYTFKFFYPDSFFLANFMMVLFPVMSGISALVFLKSFLHLRKQLPLFNTVINLIIAVYCVVMFVGVLGHYTVAAQLALVTVMIAAIVVVVIGVKLSFRNYRPAKFFLLAWTVFLASVIVFVLRNFGILPYNNLTYYALQIGSACEVILLSFALADKINILEAEKRVSREEALRISQENERIIREQNIILESKVNERTVELRASNEELGKTLKELQDAETQLVESEKMASLGQLTAGIAHEINNPINFVTSNVSPLRRDLDMIVALVDQLESITLLDISIEEKKKQIQALKDEIDYDYLKTEIDFLIKGIGDGASRTAEIVKGLRVFSRLDEDDLKKADINEGLDSTLVIVNHLLNNSVYVEKNYSGIPMIECFPGKLNQVFLNMMSNAIHAIHTRWQGLPGGKLILGTWNDEDNVYVSIKDNGTGMDETTKRKLFEPFFTTKAVGEGTGLGMSIAYNTIRKHNGYIAITTALGEGTEFIITIPIVHELEEVKN
jgi:signal transduction histidine kinase